jgi:hypothetical protein
MITKKQEVKSQTKVVGFAEFPEFSSTAEAIEALGEKDVCGLINTQVKTNAMNEVRASATGKPPKAKLQLMAQVEMCALPPEEMTKFAGDPQAVQKWLEERMQVIEARLDAEREARLAEVAKASAEEEATTPA